MDDNKVKEIGKNIEDFIIGDEEYLKNNGVEVRPLTDEEYDRLNQSAKDYENWLAENRRREAEEHKRKYIESLIIPGDVEASLRKIAEAIYNLDMGKAERPVYLR